MKRPFRVPVSIGKFTVLPFFGILFCIFMLFQLEWIVLIIGAALIVLGWLLSYVDMKKV
jgi:hypothetical protein